MDNNVEYIDFCIYESYNKQQLIFLKWAKTVSPSKQMIK